MVNKSITISRPYPKQWSCGESRMISFFVEGEETGIRKLLQQTPFEFISADYQLWLCSLHGHTLALDGAYLECAATIPVRYKGQVGGFSPYMYCTCVDAILAGREIYGYPKRLCEMDWIETPLAICSRVNADGKTLVKTAFVPMDGESEEMERIERLEKQTEKRLTLKQSISPDTNDEAVSQVLYRDLARKTTSAFCGRGYVELNELPGHFVHQLGMKRIIGSKFTTSSYGGGNESVAALD